MLKLNNNGDATIKCLNLDLFNRAGGGGGGTAFLWYEFIQIQNVIFHFLFHLSTSPVSNYDFTF